MHVLLQPGALNCSRFGSSACGWGLQVSFRGGTCCQARGVGPNLRRNLRRGFRKRTVLGWDGQRSDGRVGRELFAVGRQVQGLAARGVWIAMSVARIEEGRSGAVGADDTKAAAGGGGESRERRIVQSGAAGERKHRMWSGPWSESPVKGAGAAAETAQTTSNSASCQFWLPKKGRFCSNRPKAGESFCGNHLPNQSELRVPCPLDPSHSILKSDLDAHLLRCPAAKIRTAAAEAAYFRPGINFAGRQEGQLGEKQHSVRQDAVRLGNSREGEGGAADGLTKKELVMRMGPEGMLRLLAKIEAAFESCCSAPVAHCCLWPAACNEWEKQARQSQGNIPFEPRHAAQQASIIGNMQQMGLITSRRMARSADPSHQIAAPKWPTDPMSPLSDSAVHSREQRREGARTNEISEPVDSGPEVAGKRPESEEHREDGENSGERIVFVEFGAGRGYLSQMLCSCCRGGATEVVMVERRSYKLKADRALRQQEGIQMQRIRADIADLYLPGIPLLQARPFVAMSKHLCGSATDLTLRCCVNASQVDPQQTHAPSPPPPSFHGAAIATCCHHLCTADSYINMPFFYRLGFTNDDFDAMTWMSSWAVAGREGASRKQREGIEQEDLNKGDVNERKLHEEPLQGSNGHRSLSSEEASDRVDDLIEGGLASSCISVRDAMSNKHDWLPSLVSLEKKEAMGWKCKRLIDQGRLDWLLGIGYEARIVEYVTKNVSPENSLLLAKKI